METNTIVAPRRAMLEHLRVQLAAVFVIQALAAFLATPFYEGLGAIQAYLDSYPQIITTVLYSGVASMFAVWIIRQLSDYPGTRIVAYLVPCTLLAYSLVALVVFALRLEYIRPAVLYSFLGSLAAIHFDYFLRLRHRLPHLVLVPGGNLRGIAKTDGVKITSLTRATDNTPNADMVVADLRHDHPVAWERYLARCVVAGIPVHDAKSVTESLTGKVEFEHLSENSFGAVLPSNVYLKLKYLADLTITLVVLPVVVILILLASCAIWYESGWPVLFKQKRMGFRGRPFVMYKLRTMHLHNGDGKLFTSHGDNRVTRAGRFLRKYRIDELPQVWNIIKGEMSWIGPRPEAVELSLWYESEIPFYLYRHAVRPGITGWAQVFQGNVAEIEAITEKLQYDFYYIKNFSPLLDALIVLKTLRTILSGFGSK